MAVSGLDPEGSGGALGHCHCEAVGECAVAAVGNKVTVVAERRSYLIGHPISAYFFVDPGNGEAFKTRGDDSDVVVPLPEGLVVGVLLGSVARLKSQGTGTPFRALPSVKRAS